MFMCRCKYINDPIAFSFQVHASVNTWDWKCPFFIYGPKFDCSVWLATTNLLVEFVSFDFHRNSDLLRFSKQKKEENYANEEKV